MKLIATISRSFAPSIGMTAYTPTHFAILALIIALGTLIRFWGLGNVGLHGDEETMAMPALAILETGTPHLPSGMLYVRAPLQLYAMAGSVWLFGHSEWALRLPSAVFGSFAGLAAFLMGRRFLPPAFNLAFVASITFMPDMVETSQTARMYGLWVVCVMLFVAGVFSWEQSRRAPALLLALGAWLIALQFHTLSIFVAPLLLWPGLRNSSWRQLLQGAAAFLFASVTFHLFNQFTGRHYPQWHERPEFVGQISHVSGLGIVSSLHLSAILAFLAASAAVCVLAFHRASSLSRGQALLSSGLFGAGLIAMSLLQFHVGVTLFFIGAILSLRSPSASRWPLLLSTLLAVAISFGYLAMLLATNTLHGRKLIGALIGEPSVWPLLRLLQSTPAVAALFISGVALVMRDFVKGALLPEYVLFSILAIWFPLFLMGFFQWNVELRYTMGQLPALTMCAFAGLAVVAHRHFKANGDEPSTPLVLSAFALVTLCIVNPPALLRTVNPHYGPFPDHKGAAEYIRSLRLGPNAVLVAEDVLQQTYYLGHVDYWLRQIDDAQLFSVVEGDRLLDQYTSTPVIGTGDALTAILNETAGKELYIIGTGEDFVDGRASYRGRGIEEVLASDRFDVVYEGRDGKTKVWKLVY